MMTNGTTYKVEAMESALRCLETILEGKPDDIKRQAFEEVSSNPQKYFEVVVFGMATQEMMDFLTLLGSKPALGEKVN